jgi:hypothetical protein
MLGIYRVPVSLIFKSPLADVESRTSLWNIIKTVFGLKKCKFRDFTLKIKKEP